VWRTSPERRNHSIEALPVVKARRQAAQEQGRQLPQRRGLQDFERRDEALFDVSKITAEGECWQQTGIRGRFQRTFESIRCVVA
jgi:hypothetical protein